MEYYFQYLSSDLVSVVAITLAFSILVYYSLLSKTKGSQAQKLPPQAGGAWPIIGHLHLFAGSSEPLQTLLGKMADKYGPIFTVKMGVHRALVVSSSEMAKECFTTNDRVFASRPKSLAAEILGYNYAYFFFSPYGHYFSEIRKMVALKVLSNQRIEMLKHTRESEVQASIKAIYQRCIQKGNNDDKVLVEMKEWFGAINQNVVFRMIVGKPFLEATNFSDSDGNYYRLGMEPLSDFLRLAGSLVVADAVPLLRWLDLGGHERAMRKIAKQVDHVLQGWLQQHKHKRMKIINSGHVIKVDEEGDFMDAMISILESDDQVTNIYDADTVIKATCLALLLASVHSTAGILTWALALLLNNREALKKAQQELDEQIGREWQVKESDTEKLVYIQAIIKETMRLYHPGPLSLPHESIQDCIVGGYHVPAGTRLLVNLSKIHRDPKVWSDPNEFTPERFLTTHKSVDVKGQDFELLPFGSGRRMCPGVSLGLKLAHFTLASLLHGFEIATPRDEPIDMRGAPGQPNRKATPLQVIVTPRLPAQLYE